MKVAHILNQFLPQHVAGTEIYALNLGIELEKLGVHSSYVIPNYRKDYSEKYEYEGLQVIKYAEPSIVDRALQMGKRKPDGLTNFIEVLKTEKPDIVHFHEIAGSNGITFAHIEEAKKLGCKIVTTLHVSRYTAAVDNDQITDDIFDPVAGARSFYRSKGFNRSIVSILLPASDIMRRLKIDSTGLGRVGMALSVSGFVEKKRIQFLKLVENCDKVVTIARWYHELLLQNHVNRNKLAFIAQGINTSVVPSELCRKRSEKLRLIFIGRVSHIKGVKGLIEAVSLINEDTILLDIYGDSTEDDLYKEDCKSMIANRANIQLKGLLQPNNVLSTIASYDLLVLPSTVHEMSPLVILEAFAAEVPVLASDSMGAREQIENGKNGWLFKMTNVHDLAEKLNWLVDNRHYIKKASQNIPAVRSVRDVAADYLQLYNKILKGSTEA